jgi:hypothetical protein
VGGRDDTSAPHRAVSAAIWDDRNVAAEREEPLCAYPSKKMEVEEDVWVPLVIKIEGESAPETGEEKEKEKEQNFCYFVFFFALLDSNMIKCKRTSATVILLIID